MRRSNLTVASAASEAKSAACRVRRPRPEPMGWRRASEGARTVRTRRTGPDTLDSTEKVAPPPPGERRGGVSGAARGYPKLWGRKAKAARWIVGESG